MIRIDPLSRMRQITEEIYGALQIDHEAMNALRCLAATGATDDELGARARELITHPRQYDGDCRRPPDGWRCSRPAGHDGPCAAVPASRRFLHRSRG